MCGLSFATGAGRELGMEEPCQLFVYNSIVRLRQSEVYEVVQKFQSFFSCYCLYGICCQGTAFVKALV